MIWIRLDTEKAEILGADEHPAHGEWIEWGEARRIIREHNELAARSEIGPGHDPTGEGSAYQPPTCQGEGHAKSAGPLQFPRVVAWPTEEHPCLTDPPNLPGSGPQLRKAIAECNAYFDTVDSAEYGSAIDSDLACVLARRESMFPASVTKGTR